MQVLTNDLQCSGMFPGTHVDTDIAKSLSNWWNAGAQSSQNRPLCSSLLHRLRITLNGVQQTREIIQEVRAWDILCISASRNVNIYRAEEKPGWHQ